jgi:hypothetical protein
MAKVSILVLITLPKAYVRGGYLTTPAKLFWKSKKRVYTLRHFRFKGGWIMKFLVSLSVCAAFTATMLSSGCSDKKSGETSTVQSQEVQMKVSVLPQKVAIVSPKDLDVPANLGFLDKVEKHRQILLKLFNVMDTARNAKKAAEAANSLQDYKLAEEDMQTTQHFLVPYAIGEGQAKALKKEGYLFAAKPTKGEVCNRGKCTEVDPIVALFMILAGALTQEFNKPDGFGPNNELVKFLDKPLGGEGSELVKIREFVLAHDENGEIARYIRDPIKRPIEITQTIRDKIIPPSDTGEIAKAVRDPVKCTVGHLWGAC